MKHSADNSISQPNLLQALQKNKVIQGKLTECQHSYYIQLLKDMQTHKVEEKYNRELLYTWKKESYIRQLNKNLQEYEKAHFGVKDAYYEYQLRNLGNIIAGQQSLAIPPSEEERRLDINSKYLQFLRKNPLQTSSSSRRAVKSANSLTQQSGNNDEDEEGGEESTFSLDNTWKHIHAQSAVGFRQQQQNNTLPSIHRSSTMDEIRRNKTLTKRLIPPTVAIISSVLVTTTPETINSSSDVKFQQSSTKSPSNYLGLPGGIEPLLITSETLDKHTRADLITMRSVRRPRKNPSDLNLLFETRKRIYQINKRALDSQILQRKLQPNFQFDPSKQINSNTPVDNLFD